ncbi:MAG: trypsin-like peptidase domain-containing protein [Bryobacteraceae bacterium]|nr:trypsin-like peptidase domain-containing protein [Bryobacteraceae bacterium]
MRPFAILLLVAPVLLAQRTRGELREMSGLFESLVERVDPAVVQVITRGFAPASESSFTVQTRRGSGSGVIVDPSGYIVTNAHVVGVARRVQVLLPQPAAADAPKRSILKPTGKLLNAEVVGQDRQTDIAVLKVDAGPLTALPFGDSEAIRQGQLVFAFGSPFGLENSVSQGVVSSVARQVRSEDTMIYVQTDAAINPGNSGGPLVDTEGRVVGINTFILSDSGANTGVGFAAPSNIVRTVYEQIRKFGRVRRGQIGVIAQTITPGLAHALDLPRDWGVLLSDVTDGSPAAAAGLEVKDIVLTFNGKPMENARQLGVNIYGSAGETVTLEILRRGQKLEKRVAVLERPRDPDRILGLVSGERNLLARLGILAVDVDEKVTPLLPPLRRLSGVVVAGVVADVSVDNDRFQPGDVIYEINNVRVSSLAGLREQVEKLGHGVAVAAFIERAGQLQYLLLELE